MAICTFCGKSAPDEEVKAGVCSNCRSSSPQLTPPEATTDEPRRHASKFVSPIVLTTASEIPKRQISEIVEVIGSEAALGLNIFKDVANAWRDFVGGRSATSQKAIRDARALCLQELKTEAARVGADAVIAVRLDFSEIPTSGNGGIFFLAATGTAVKLERETA